MKRALAACSAALVIAAASPARAQTVPPHEATRVEVSNPRDMQKIVVTVFRPSASLVDPALDVPVILHSHGWNGSRATSASGDVKAMLDAGFGVVSIDQRGHGESGGLAHVQDPTRETEDIKIVIDHIATLDWVAHDTDPSGAPIADDPVLGAIGGSYGGGYQTMTTLDELADQGRTRLDALAPEITWYDLPESLAPQRVPRTTWSTLLYAAGADMLPRYVHEAQIWGTTTGQWPDGTLFGQPAPGVPNLDAEFHKHGPVHFAEQGIKINVPVLLRQGTSDNLFNLNQGLDIFHKALTDEARAQSYFIGYNGGHALPNALPAGTAAGSDTCVGDGAAWNRLRIEFFRKAFAGSTGGLLPNRYSFTNFDGSSCIRGDFIDTAVTAALKPLGAGVVTTAGAGAPQHIEVMEGPVTVTGVPKLSGAVTALGLDSRAFFGLSIGTSPADAKVLQNNLMPLRENLPVVGKPFDIELPGLAATVPAGKKLFLTVTPVSDMFIAHGSRTPGALTLSDLSLTLPRPGFTPAPEQEPRASAMSLVVDGKGSNSRLLATLTDAETGTGIGGATIDFFSSGTLLGSATTDADGVAALPLEGRYRGGSHSFEARFAGSEDHSPSSASATS